MDLEQVKSNFRQEISEFSEKAQAFAAGEIDRKSYKGFSGGFGSYAQRGETGNMLRLRLLGGRVTMPQFAFIAKSIAQKGIERLKITTCQTIQLHDLSADDTVALMKDALAVDIVTKGGGGDHPRNVMVSPLAGFDPDEPFDVRPVAEALGRYLLGRINELHLPRKLKIAFSSDDTDEVHAAMRDLGFIACADGTFDVYCAGGLGPNPKLGVKVAQGVLPEDAAYIVEAMISVFCEYGNYENRAKARTRYLQETLGVEGLKQAFECALKRIKSEKGIKLEIENWTPNKKADGILPLPRQRVTGQKQPGLYAVEYHPIGGVLSGKAVCRLYETINQFEQVELRLRADGGMYIVNLTAPEAETVLEATADSAITDFERSTSCIGATTCQQGVRDSQGLLEACREAVQKAQLPNGALPRIAISGCPSSCGAHQANCLGFVGGVKVVDKTPQPAFTLFAGGNTARGVETLGTAVCTILERDIPRFLVELGCMVQASGLDYSHWVAENHSAMLQLAQKYSQ